MLHGAISMHAQCVIGSKHLTGYHGTQCLSRRCCQCGRNGRKGAGGGALPVLHSASLLGHTFYFSPSPPPHPGQASTTRMGWWRSTTRSAGRQCSTTTPTLTQRLCASCFSRLVSSSWCWSVRLGTHSFFHRAAQRRALLSVRSACAQQRTRGSWQLGSRWCCVLPPGPQNVCGPSLKGPCSCRLPAVERVRGPAGCLSGKWLGGRQSCLLTWLGCAPGMPLYPAPSLELSLPPGVRLPSSP